MKRVVLRLALLFLGLTGCPSSTSMCEKAVDNIMARCGTCFATSSSLGSSRGSAGCKQALMGMCGSGSASSASSSSSSNPSAFLACVASATNCDGILLCN